MLPSSGLKTGFTEENALLQTILQFRIFSLKCTTQGSSRVHQWRKHCCVSCCVKFFSSLGDLFVLDILHELKMKLIWRNLDLKEQEVITRCQIGSLWLMFQNRSRFSYQYLFRRNEFYAITTSWRKNQEWFVNGCGILSSSHSLMRTFKYHLWLTFRHLLGAHPIMMMPMVAEGAIS